MSQIYRALKTPDELYEDTEHETIVAVKKTDEKYIIMAYRKEAELVKLITIYYTTKLDKIIRSKTARGAWKRIK